MHVPRIRHMVQISDFQGHKADILSKHDGYHTARSKFLKMITPQIGRNIYVEMWMFPSLEMTVEHHLWMSSHLYTKYTHPQMMNDRNFAALCHTFIEH